MVLMKNFKVSKGYIGECLVSFAKDETGADWYESQEKFRDDTLKIVFSQKGVIISMSEDVSALWPGENSVTEVPLADVPSGVDINGGWMFDGERIIPRVYTAEEWQAKAEAQRQTLIAAASETIRPWEREAHTGILDDDDNASLIEWTKYVKALRKLVLSGVSDEASYSAIEWPDKPATE